MSSGLRVQMGLVLLSSSYSSWLISSGFRVQMGLVLLSSSSSVYFSLIVFFFFFVFFLFFLFFVIGHLFVAFLFYQEFDWVTNKLRVFLDNIFDAFFLNIVSLIFFQVQYDLGSSSKRFSLRIGSDGE